MKVLNIVETVVDGPGFRSSIYFAGCSHKCKGCHNTETWEFNQGKDYTPAELFDKLQEIGNNKVTLSGGDPLYQNYFDLLALLSMLHSHYYNVWVYTGFTWEEIVNDSHLKDFLKYIDVIVDGKFEIDKRDTNLAFRGSSNQRLIDVQKTLDTGIITLFEC